MRGGPQKRLGQSCFWGDHLQDRALAFGRAKQPQPSPCARFVSSMPSPLNLQNIVQLPPVEKLIKAAKVTLKVL
jgi:hypothetical protein